MADFDVKKNFDELHTAVNAFREEMKSRVPDPAKVAKIEGDIARFDAANQKFITDREVERKATQDRIDELEKKINRGAFSGSAAVEREVRAIEAKETFFAFARFGHPIHDRDPGRVEEKWGQFRQERGLKLEAKSLFVSDDTTGGYLAPPEYVREIIKAEVLVSPVRDLVRIRQTGQRSTQLPKRTQTAAAVWVSEQATRVETQNPGYGMVECPTHELTAEVYISYADLEDSLFDLEAEITAEFAEQFAVSEGAAVVGGNGSGKPFGFTDPGQGIATTGTGGATIASATGAKGDAIIGLVHAVDSPYARNGRFVLNRQTLGSVRKLADTQGRYLWEPSPAVGLPSMILGYPYSELPDMPAEGANALPIGFGDWKRAYTLVDRLSLSLTRDPYTQANKGLVKFLARRRVGGQVVLAKAIRLLKCA